MFAVEGLRPVSGEALLQGAPGVAQAVDLDRGEVDIAGAQVADSNPVMAFRLFHRGVEIGQIVGHGRARHKSEREACSAGNTRQHRSSPDFDAEPYIVSQYKRR